MTERLPFPTAPVLADADAVIFTKYANWQYEREIRVWAALDEKRMVIFLKFGDHLQLSKVIAGARCPVTEKEIQHALGSLADNVVLVKARGGFTRFEIVKDQLGFR